jgi:hypothetical protein
MGTRGSRSSPHFHLHMRVRAYPGKRGAGGVDALYLVYICRVYRGREGTEEEG